MKWEWGVAGGLPPNFPPVCCVVLCCLVSLECMTACVRFHPDGNLVAACSFDRAIHVPTVALQTDRQTDRHPHR